MLLPWLLDPLTRRVLGMGTTSEMLLLDSLRNLLVVLVSLRGSEFCSRLGATASLFLVLYLYAACLTQITTMFLVAYVLIGIAWLSGTYWNRVRHHLPVASRSETPRVAWTIVAIAATCLLLVSTGFWNASRAAHVLPGWLPSSGGSGETDPFAWSGIGDGDQLVRGTDRADSFGPVESSLFLESDQPSLYDMFNDLYEEPEKLERSRKASIPLSPSTNQESRKIQAQTQHAGREFSSVRKPASAATRPLEDRKSDACLYVNGRVPLHLAVEYYNHWDGTHLSQQNVSAAPSPYLMNVGADRWLTWAVPFNAELFARESLEQHQLRVVRLGSPRVPMPPQASRLTVEHLHSAHLFAWTPDGALRFVADQLPSLSVLHVASLRTSPERLAHARFRTDAQQALPSHAVPTTMIDPRVAAMAEAWAEGATNDWQRIVQVVAGIRAHAQLDATVRADEKSTDTVRDFLCVARRGPDYLFAISTAVMLQHLGFDTRVVTGFYANPENYDPITRRTPVYSKDLHFWVEVRERQGNWITVDPSPGYEVLYERTTWHAALWSWIQGACTTLASHPIWTTSWILLVGLVYCERFFISCLLRWTVWSFRKSDLPRQRILGTLRLLESTIALSPGNGRHSDMPIGHWLHSLVSPEGIRPAEREAFDRMTRWALYAASSAPAYREEEIATACRGMARWCLRWAVETERSRWPQWMQRLTRHSSPWLPTVREDGSPC